MESKYCLFVGTRPEKGFDLLLELANKNTDVHFKVVGGITPVDAKNIEFLGRVSDEELIALYKNATCFISCSIWPEPAGLTILEAQREDTPVIVLNRGGSPEYVYHGTMVDTLNERIVGKALRGEVGFVSDKASKTFFSAKRMADEYEEAYEMLTFTGE